MTLSIQSFLLPFGERDTKLNKKKNPIRRYMVVQFLLITLVVSFVAFGIYQGIAKAVPTHLFLCEHHKDYWDHQVKTAFDAFQEYVTENNLSCDQAIQPEWWYQSNTNVTLFFDPLPFLDTKNPEHQSYLKENEIFVLTCSDGNLYATSYSPGAAYRYKWEIGGMLSGVAVAFAILFSYIGYLLHRIKRLHGQIMSSTQKGCDIPINLRGQDELAQLSQKIEEMRCSLLDLLAQEQESQKSQTQLIATLSHDIRTPLTKLMGYLNILHYKENTSHEEKAHYLCMAEEKAQQLKNLTDGLLNCSFVKGKMIHDDREVVNGPVFLAQMLCERCYELEQDGFTIELPAFDGNYALNVSVDAFQRICDNILSNILKYASKEHPVRIQITDHADLIYLSISNHKAIPQKEIQHHGLGLLSMRELTTQLGGTMSIIDSKDQFEIHIALPKVNRPLDE